MHARVERKVEISSHVDLVDLAVQLFVGGKLFQELLFLVLAPSVVIFIAAALVAA